MQKFSYTITDETGIHARPAGLLVKEAKKHRSKITLSANGKTAEATKLMSVMGLGATKGTEISVEIDGEDEDATAKAIENFFKENL